MKSADKKILINAKSGEQAGEVNLQWNSIKEARSYTIEMKSKVSKNWRIVDIVNESQYCIDKLKPCSQYYFRVSAVYKNGKSSVSNIIQKIVQ